MLVYVCHYGLWWREHVPSLHGEVERLDKGNPCVPESLGSLRDSIACLINLGTDIGRILYQALDRHLAFVNCFIRLVRIGNKKLHLLFQSPYFCGDSVNLVGSRLYAFDLLLHFNGYRPCLATANHQLLDVWHVANDETAKERNHANRKESLPINVLLGYYPRCTCKGFSGYGCEEWGCAQ